MPEQIDSFEYEPESRLIIQCSQTTVDTEKIRSDLANMCRPLNWPYIVKIAGRNGLLPLVCSNILHKLPDLVDEEVRESLADFLGGHMRNNLLQTRKVIEISETLEAEGIPILPFKGPTLSIQAYGDISLRQFVDLDILVQPRHFDKAIQRLKACGYIPIEEPTWLKRKSLFFTRKKDIGLVSADRQVRIELHWKLSGTHFAMPFEIDQLWKRLDAIELGGAKLRALPLCDLFVYLCLHGSRHGWEKLAWVCDISEIVRGAESSANIDWCEVQQHARKHGCERAVELGLYLVHDLFGRKARYPEIDAILNNPAFTRIAEDLRNTAFAPELRSTEMKGWYLYHLSLKERLVDRFRIRLVYLIWYLKLAVKPNEMDEAVLKLPAVFSLLYYVVRPIRLAITLPRKKASPGLTDRL